MAQEMTPEEVGRKILDIYKQENVKAGEMLPTQVIQTKWINAGERSEELSKGLKWLLDNDYLEQKDDKADHFLFLTEAGFRTM
jgi:hypothetical protein